MQVIHVLLPDAGTEEALKMAGDLESLKNFTEYVGTDAVIALLVTCLTQRVTT